MATPIAHTRFWLHDEGTGSPPTYRFTDAQIQEFLDLEKVNDDDGLTPDDPSWVPSYDVMSAAGRGWMWLAGLTGNASAYSVGDVSTTFDLKYCKRVARDLLGSKSGTALRSDEAPKSGLIGRERD